ncbi:MAG: FmdB family zinc ribbon protein [Deltaproteobacteria bacterium]
MPIYDYYCCTCGSFEKRRPMRDSSEPAACPVCNAWSQRMITAPSLNLMKAASRKAEARNEKSANEPGVVHRVLPDAPERRPVRHQAHDHEVHKPVRPWMIGHS